MSAQQLTLWKRHISLARCLADIVRTYLYLSRDTCPHYILLRFSAQVMLAQSCEIKHFNCITYFIPSICLYFNLLQVTRGLKQKITCMKEEVLAVTVTVLSFFSNFHSWWYEPLTINLLISQSLLVLAGLPLWKSCSYLVLDLSKLCYYIYEYACFRLFT